MPRVGPYFNLLVFPSPHISPAKQCVQQPLRPRLDLLRYTGRVLHHLANRRVVALHLLGQRLTQPPVDWEETYIQVVPRVVVRAFPAGLAAYPPLLP